MDTLKCLVFDIYGEYGHFRKYYTTASPLTYSIPPRTAVCGMIAAIIGIDREEYLKYFRRDDAYISLRLLKRVKKLRLGLNYILTEDAPVSFVRFKNHTPINMEYLKDPAFRIYFYHKDPGIYEKLKICLETGKTCYTPCLGLSEHVAFLKYAGEFEAYSVINSSGMVEIQSVIPDRDKSLSIFFEDGEYMKEMMPNELGEKREPLEYVYIVFERTASKAVKCSIGQYWRMDSGENIVFM